MEFFLIYLTTVFVASIIPGPSMILALEPSPTENPMEGSSFRKRFSQGFYVAAANPKAIVFFAALFPQFIDPTSPPLAQYLILVVPLSIIAFGCMMIYTLSGARITKFFSHSNPLRPPPPLPLPLQIF